MPSFADGTQTAPGTKHRDATGDVRRTESWAGLRRPGKFGYRAPADSSLNGLCAILGDSGWPAAGRSDFPAGLIRGAPLRYVRAMGIIRRTVVESAIRCHGCISRAPDFHICPRSHGRHGRGTRMNNPGPSIPSILPGGKPAWSASWLRGCRLRKSSRLRKAWRAESLERKNHGQIGRWADVGMDREPPGV